MKKAKGRLINQSEFAKKWVCWPFCPWPCIRGQHFPPRSGRNNSFPPSSQITLQDGRNSYAHSYTYMHIHTYTHAHTCSLMHTHTHSHTLTYPHMLTLMHTHTCPHIPICAHTYAHSLPLTHLNHTHSHAPSPERWVPEVVGIRARERKEAHE